ncbi:MAG: pyridoxamine 5-phosphate oxidase, partial [Treponema sp.]|nr:pyridoxamine 5-phosphate oxidase [Treponema sp.]
AYFCTNSEKPLYRQLTDKPYVSYCTFPGDFEPVLSINGKVVFVEDPALKSRALEGNPHVKTIFKTPDNPVFKIFYIDVK